MLSRLWVFGIVCLTLCSLAVTTGAQDRAMLVNGVQEISAPDAIPGDFAVFGKNAFVVMTGRMGKSRLPLIVAAHYGRGRVVAVGHESFFNASSLKTIDNAHLAANIAHWVSGKTAGVRIGLHNQDSGLQTTLTAANCQVSVLKTEDLPDRLKNLDLLWLNQSSLDGKANRNRVEAIRRWVQHGGGLVITGPAWGWQETMPSLDLLHDHSGNQLLLPIGIAFATGMLDGTGPHGYVVDGDTMELTQVEPALHALEAHAAKQRTLSGAELQQVTATLGEAVGAMPENQNDLIRRVQTLCADQGGDLVPTRQTPITTAMPFARLKATLDWQQLRHLPAEKVTASPAATSFPGAVPAEAKRQTQTIAVDTRVPLWHGTGLYAAPGELITVTVPVTAVGKGLAIRIGSHTDTLWHLDRWERFPEITMSRPLDKATVHIASPFGGTLYVEVPENCGLGAVQVTIEHAVAAPRFVRGVTSLNDWKQTIRNAPGPWAELEGKLVILSVPSSAVRDLDDPEALMAYWDEVMEHCYTLYAAPKRNRPERYCVDRQISAGYMHSGYPIMTGDDVAKTFCDVRVLRGSVGIKCWGFYHEMGHNFQQTEWTWDAWGEVTNNLFSLYGTEKLNGVLVGAHPAMTTAEIQKRMQRVATAPGKEHYYEADPWYPLTMFWLMRQEVGWAPFTQMFAVFRDMPADQRPKTEAEKHDQFLIQFSRATGRNLSDYLAAWGVELSESARATVANLPAWMPANWPKP